MRCPQTSRTHVHHVTAHAPRLVTTVMASQDAGGLSAATHGSSFQGATGITGGGVAGRRPMEEYPPIVETTPHGCHTPPPLDHQPLGGGGGAPRHAYPYRQHSLESQQHPYPPPPPPIARDLSVESSHSNSPAPEHRHGTQHHNRTPAGHYSAARHNHSSEQQRLLAACRNSPTTCCRHGSDIIGISDYVSHLLAYFDTSTHTLYCRQCESLP